MLLLAILDACRPRLCWRAAALVILAMFVSFPIAAGAEEPSDELLLKNTGWGRFKPGAWQHVRVIVETLDPKGKITNTTSSDRITTLVTVAPQSVTLELDITAEVAGKRLDAPLQLVTQGCHGEPSGQTTEVRDLEPTSSTIEGRKITCRVREFQIADKDQKRRVLVYYNRDVAPVVLRRQCEARSQDGARQTVQSELEVVSLNTPYKVLKQMMPASVIRTIQKTDSTSITTQAVLVSDVPGGIVSSTSQELDAEGKLVRRTTLELVGWGAQSDLSDPPSAGRRRESRRSRRHSK